ncbi:MULTISPECIES: cytosine deaminase [Pacificibacter]|uniref:cytosine deaminase n=1 Tax=Pacificibacter TaxID=1042323 RepID=UPI0026E41CE0|nr:cytosine deaminase [Pacificibacter sp. 1_MG-2023]MDO6616609.1 cytosine deaminase [Pacificibacter sp. 1_MG-2023]
MTRFNSPMTFTNARVHATHLATHLAHPTGPADDGGFHKVNVTLQGGKIRKVTADVHTIEGETTNLAGRIITPTFIDCHTHLDKGHIWPRQPNPDGSFGGALSAVATDTVANWSADDLMARMDFSLRCAYAHGTSALRTHIDSQAPQDGISWPVFETLRKAWAGRITLQAVCLVGIEALRETASFDALAKRVQAAGGVLGAVTYMVPDIEALIDQAFATAIQYGLDLDFHADETGDPDAVSLHLIAQAALRHRFTGHINVGHCCSLARQSGDIASGTLDLVAKAGLSITTLPMCNLYLQDRRHDGTTPRWRGTTLVHEMKARGINVAIASDNTRDPFYAYGDLDMVEVYRMATRVLHLDHPVGQWPAAMTAAPARVMGIAPPTIAAGAPADMIMFRARSWTELLSRPQSDRIVLRDGTQIDTTLPDYSDLDALMESSNEH